MSGKDKKPESTVKEEIKDLDKKIDNFGNIAAQGFHQTTDAFAQVNLILENAVSSIKDIKLEIKGLKIDKKETDHEVKKNNDEITKLKSYKYLWQPFLASLTGMIIALGSVLGSVAVLMHTSVILK